MLLEIKSVLEVIIDLKYILIISGQKIKVENFNIFTYIFMIFHHVGCVDLSGRWKATKGADSLIMTLSQTRCTGKAIGHWSYTTDGDNVILNVNPVVKATVTDPSKVKWSNGWTYEKLFSKSTPIFTAFHITISIIEKKKELKELN